MVKTKLQQVRMEKGLSQDEFAKMVGMTQSNYSRKENGLAKFTMPEWKRMARELNVPLEELDAPEESQIFIFNDQATGNVNSVVNYNIPLSIWENQQKYTRKLEEENAQLKEKIERLEK
ncbi:MAG: helix-turn-helix domain-containing protein [Flavobacteriaceae bacterium]|jgi:transcriptional regulator with XRE-family HTH domain|nr:helix-turn-helix domain-containing protein [Flavobacteriaceae bacterium]